MDLLWSWSLIFSMLFSLTFKGAFGATFTFINNCDKTIWPGVLSNSGSPNLESTGFELPKGTSRSFQAPTGWSGRFWARTGCNFDGSGQGSCSTADCGSGLIECNGAGATPPATLAEFTLGTGGGLDFYDVSLVDGYNLPMVVEGLGGVGTCASTGCVTDLNRQCPAELRVGDGEACRSACEAFGKPEYCCSGEYGNPNTCRPSVYSEMFKSACPRSYSYAYDDATSTFTCSGADYTLTFCPSYANSQKSSRDPTPTTTPATPTATGTGTGTGTTDGSGSLGDGSGSVSESYGSGTETGYVPGTEPGYGSGTVSGYGSGTESGTESTSSGGAMLADASWLAGLAVGDSTRNLCSTLKATSSIASATAIFIISSLYL